MVDSSCLSEPPRPPLRVSPTLPVGLSNPSTPALPTLPHVAVRVEVVAGQRVPLHTVGLTRVVSGRMNAPQDVPAVCDWLQVRWVDARAVSAEMVECQAVRNRPDDHLVSDSMSLEARSRLVPLPTDPELPISPDGRGCPVPAPVGLVDVAPEQSLVDVERAERARSSNGHRIQGYHENMLDPAKVYAGAR